MNDKKKLYFQAAEAKYVNYGLSLSDIATEFNLSNKTLSCWKKEGGWEEKRHEIIRRGEKLHDRLYSLAENMVTLLEHKLEAGEEISPSMINSLSRIIPNTANMKRYEEERGEEKPKDKPDVTGIIAQAKKELFGI